MTHGAFFIYIYIFYHTHHRNNIEEKAKGKQKNEKQRRAPPLTALHITCPYGVFITTRNRRRHRTTDLHLQSTKNKEALRGERRVGILRILFFFFWKAQYRKQREKNVRFALVGQLHSYTHTNALAGTRNAEMERGHRISHGRPPARRRVKAPEEGQTKDTTHPSWRHVGLGEGLAGGVSASDAGVPAHVSPAYSTHSGGAGKLRVRSACSVNLSARTHKKKKRNRNENKERWKEGRERKIYEKHSGGGPSQRRSSERTKEVKERRNGLK